MKNAIAWMARNGVAANLLMLLILFTGLISIFNIPQEVFPEFSLDSIQISVEYPGATPVEVEEAIVRRVEEQIESVDGVRRLTSVAGENIGTVVAELQLGADPTEVLDKIKAEVDRITTFPEEAEKPEVQELTNRQQVIQLAIHGDNLDEKTLKELANRIKDDLTATPEISFVRIGGVRSYEISIEVSEETLRAYGLSLLDVSNAVRLASLDLPGGSVETQSEEVLIRTKGQNYTAQDFEDIIVIGRNDGTSVRLKDIATVRDGFQDEDLITEFDGTRAAFVEIFRSGDERVLEGVETVKNYVDELRPSLPQGVEVSIWQDTSKILNSRLSLLVENGIIGLILVIIALALFLDLRLAFWVSMGIFISFMGAFAVMVYLDVSINLLSLFAFILAIGIVVDDAIVIGENIFFEQDTGGSPVEAAIRGAQRLARPVIFAVFTTIAAFSPLLFAPGVIGKITREIPKIVITVLVLSLIESLFILPLHLSHKRKHGKRESFLTPVIRFIERLQTGVSRQLKRFTEGPLERAINFSVRRYGVVIASALGMVIISAGLVGGGYVQFSFLPDIEGENVVARLEMPEGTPVEETQRIMRYILSKGEEAAAEIQVGLPEDHPSMTTHVYASVGQQPSLNQGPNAQSGTILIQSHLAEINFELLDAEVRIPSAESFETLWREKVGAIPNAKTLTFSSALISLGKPVQMELAAPNPEVLDLAVTRVKNELGQFGGVFEIQDDQERGKREVQLSLLPSAQTLGITVDQLARQVRAAYYGAESLRIQRGRDEVKVMVRLPNEERNALADLQNLRIRTTTGMQIPLSEVAEASLGYSSSNIQRRDRQRVVTVSADVDPEVVSGQQVVSELSAGIVPQLEADYPGLRVSFEGEQREQADALSALLRGFLIAMFVVYALLAIPFKSYGQPLVIMSAIPFGIIGAILGHLMLGLQLGILSLFGIVGLSGVVVNDSLVLIDFVNQKRDEGLPMAKAIIEAGKQRFRPILLTSVTTFLGLFPLILEKSVQAQFLIPMAVSLGFGILFATVIIMLVVPAMAMLQYDATLLLSRFARYLRGETDNTDSASNGLDNPSVQLSPEVRK